MQLLIRTFFFSLLLSSISFSQINNSGSITAYVDSLISVIPDVTPSNLYQVPNSTQSAVWASIIDDMLKGNYASAHTDALTIDYELVHFSDISNSKIYYILRKKGSGSNYWGTFIVDPDPLRSRVFIQIPHPLFDTNSGNQGIVVYKNTAARAFILAGTHRCNSTSLSTCDGTTAVCGGSNQFRKSDQAHNNDGPFQITTEVFKRSIPNLIVVQLHGFVKDPGYPDVILGNGTQSAPATDWLTVFRNNLTALDGTLQYKVAHIDTAWSDLTGTTNTQGRLINNSPNPCDDAAVTPTGRFLHIEQAYTGLRDNATSYAKVATAIGNTFPPDKVIASAATGNWENTSTWTGSVVPNDTTHVVISPGHTVTVTSSTAKAKSVSFLDNTAALALASSSNLSLYGDLILATETHHAFSSWAGGAKLTFAGTDDQVLMGWNKDSTNFSTSLMEMVVNKSSGKVVTAGNDMNLNIGTSLEITGGTMELTAGDDIEGRDLSGTASAPAITIQSNGTFTVHGDSSYIRRGTADTLAVGLVRNYGRLNIYGTDLNLGYNVADLYNESGGTIGIFTGWASTRLLRVDTLLLKAGSIFETSTTSNVIPSSGRTVLNAGGIYRVFGSSVNFSSSFTNNGTIEYASAGTQTVSNRSYKKLIVSNGGTKNITLTANATADTLIVNGSAALSIASASPYSLTVNNVLTLNGGNITTNANTLVLGQNTLSVGSLARVSGLVIGNFKRYIGATTISNVLFPLGTASHYYPAEISFTSAPSVGGTLSAAFTATAPGSSGLPLDDAGTTISNAATEGFWTFTAADGLSGGIYSMNLYPNEFSGIASVGSLRIVKRATSGSWQLQGTHVNGSGTVTAPVVKRSGLSGFSEFGIASGVDNPLPVELISFTALPKGRGVELVWKTAAEVNNHGFDVERIELNHRIIGSLNQSTDESMNQWKAVSFIEGHGTTNAPQEYSFVDQNLKEGKYSYRLKQIDRDGRFEYSQAVEVTVGSVPKIFSLEQNYPNPFNPSTTMQFVVPVTGKATLKIFNSIGQEVATLFDKIAEAGVYYQAIFDAKDLSSGVYFSRLTSGDKVQTMMMMMIK